MGVRSRWTKERVFSFGIVHLQVLAGVFMQRVHIVAFSSKAAVARQALF